MIWKRNSYDQGILLLIHWVFASASRAFVHRNSWRSLRVNCRDNRRGDWINLWGDWNRHQKHCVGIQFDHAHVFWLAFRLGLSPMALPFQYLCCCRNRYFNLRDLAKKKVTRNYASVFFPLCKEIWLL